MRQIDKHILEAAKLVYGDDKVEAMASVPLGFITISAWSIVGYDTIKDLEKKYSDEDILELYESLQEQSRKAAS